MKLPSLITPPDGVPPETRVEEPGQRTSRSDAQRRALALAFCRECLGWPEASGGGSRSIVENNPRPELAHVPGKMHGFQLDPQDLGHVSNAVKEWCDIHAVSLSLQYSRAAEKDDWRVCLAPHAEAQGGDACDVLLRACLDAEHDRRSRNAARAAIEAMPVRHNPAILENPWGNIGENAPTALAFCKECLGWEKARLVSDWGYVYISEKLADYPVEPRERGFHFNENHLDKIIGTVKTWCDTRAMGFVLEYFPSGSASDCWRASFPPHAEAHGDLASAALMSGCVAAHRKIAVVGIMHGLLERGQK